MNSPILKDYEIYVYALIKVILEKLTSSGSWATIVKFSIGAPWGACSGSDVVNDLTSELVLKLQALILQLQKEGVLSLISVTVMDTLVFAEATIPLMLRCISSAYEKEQIETQICHLEANILEKKSEVSWVLMA